MSRSRVPKSNYSDEHPKLDKRSLLNRYREDTTIDNLENELEASFAESPKLRDSSRDFLHSPFQLIKNGATGRRPVLHETHRATNDATSADKRASSRPHASRAKALSVSSVSSSSSCSTGSNSPKTDRANAFRNITPLNLEDMGKFQSEDTPVCRKANSRSEEFPFKKPFSHRRITSIEERTPVVLHKTPSNSRSTSPVKQLLAKQQQLQSVSLTPAQRAEKHSGRLAVANSASHGKSNSNMGHDGRSALDNYEFKELLGKGASASVYRAVNLITDAVVAIKQIEINTKEDIELMMTEIRLLKILKHENIVKYHGYVNNGQTLNIILEYCSGGSLRKLYKQRGSGLGEEEIVKYLKEILAGLKYLHNQGVIHRDVKAANVLLMHDGTVKLADFGVSSKANHKSSLVVGGSPYWMAPEVILLQGSSTASDIWSLGATVIELFTMQPPYHEFDPMAACHAIGVEDGPPIPANLSRLAKDFLEQCFQKSPEIRIDAKRLLQHPWLTITKDGSKTPRQQERAFANATSRFAMTPRNQDVSQVLAPKLREQKIPLESKDKLVGPQSPFRDEEDEFDEKHFEDVNFEMKSDKLPLKKASVDQLLTKFTEENDADDDLVLDTDRIQLHHFVEDAADRSDESDPFLESESQEELVVDPAETKIVSEVEKLVERLSEKNDNLVQDCSKLAQLVSENPVTCKVVVRMHGLIRLLELLESNDSLEVSENCLVTLNHIFVNHPVALSNFCTVGGITHVLKFNTNKYSLQLRLEVVQFIQRVIKPDQPSVTVLQMFVACGGLRALETFVQEDMDLSPEFVCCGVDGIDAIFQCKLPTTRSDLCYLLKDSLDWIAVNMRNLIEYDSSYCDKIVSILQAFSRSEPRVKSYIGTTTLFKSIFKNYDRFDRQNALKILKFISSLSSVPSNLDILDASNCLPFLVNIALEYAPPKEHFKEMANAICPTVFNLCHLNKIRQLDLLELDAIPIFANLARQQRLPFKDFVLPVLSELVMINSKTRAALWENDVFEIFIGYLQNPYWQVNSLDAIKNWIMMDNRRSSSSVILDRISDHLPEFISAFQMTTNLDFLQNFLEMIGLDRGLCRQFTSSKFVGMVADKLRRFEKNAIIEILLLKILKKMVLDNLDHTEFVGRVRSLIQNVKVGENSILVTELIKEIEQMAS